MRLEVVREILTEWAKLDGHDRCWFHPELLSRLCQVVGVPVIEKPIRMTRQEFQCGCLAYQDDLFGKRRKRHDPLFVIALLVFTALITIKWIYF
jgi:hypothetical protein